MLAPETITKAVESEIRDLVRAKRPHQVDAEELCSDVLRAGAGSVAEIERLMRELQAARSFLQSEGERIRREVAKYEHLARTASVFVKIITESTEKWRQTDSPVSTKAGVA
jgi:hypothetical protein